MNIKRIVSKYESLRWKLTLYKISKNQNKIQIDKSKRASRAPIKKLGAWPWCSAVGSEWWIIKGHGFVNNYIYPNKKKRSILKKKKKNTKRQNSFIGDLNTE